MAAPQINNIQILETYWREHPAWFGRSYGEYLHLGGNQEMLRIILKDLKTGPAMRVLDVSCALGGNARWLASIFGCKADGVDSFKPAIAAAKQLAKSQGLSELCQFTVAEARALPFSDRTFDLAITAEGDSHWPELARVVKPGGYLVGSQTASEGIEPLEAALRAVGFEIDLTMDVTRYATAFYRAKEEEAKLLVEAGLMKEQDLRSLQMHTVDMYEAGGAKHALFRAWRRA